MARGATQLSANPLSGGMIRGVLILAFSLGLLGCPFTVNQLNRLPESQPLGQPVLFNQPGPLRHEASGLVFPEWYENFQRVTAYRYDTAGLNVGIGYNDRRPDCVVAAPSTCTRLHA